MRYAYLMNDTDIAQNVTLTLKKDGLSGEFTTTLVVALPVILLMGAGMCHILKKCCMITRS